MDKLPQPFVNGNFQKMKNKNTKIFSYLEN